MTARSETTRRAILDRALECFAERGYAGTKLVDISEPLGITRAALYYYFSSKEELLVALATPYLDSVDDLLASLRPPLSDRDRWTLLNGLMEILLQQPSVSNWVERDPAVRSHADLGKRISDQTERTRRALANSDRGADLARAAAAIGALRRPIFVLGDSLMPESSRQLVDDAAHFLGLPQLREL